MFKISSLTLTLQRCGNFNKAQMNITMAFSNPYILPRIIGHTPCRNGSSFTHIHHIVNLPTKKEENAVVYPENSEYKMTRTTKEAIRNVGRISLSGVQPQFAIVIDTESLYLRFVFSRMMKQLTLLAILTLSLPMAMLI